MKTIAALLVCTLSTQAYAKKLPFIDPTDKQEAYDENMKSAGKWELISASAFTLSLVSFAGATAARQKYEKYSVLAKQRQLTEKETADKKMWLDANNYATYAGVGLLTGAIFGWAYSVHLEGSTRAWAVSAGIKF